MNRTATVSKAGFLSRIWVYLTARLEVTMLYEVSFSTTRFSKAKTYPRQVPSKEVAPIILREGVKA
ncbi:hypothetical protein [Polynucleobacter necessarius]|uniref:hypothetical protein n=1 Tax=Polynucleobacter necessarius TaxID=576610 RepID=UPI001E548743|nr:hypothetical protein [Polynucleobacter necessarius]